jgi:subtilisin-like proprotein convertase family protein
MARAAQVSGAITYTNKVFSFSSDGSGYVGTDIRPARYIDIEIRRTGDSTLLATGSTDSEGHYSLEIPNAGFTELDLYLYARSDSSPWTTVEVVDQSRYLQSVAAGPFYRSTSADFTMDFNVPTEDNSVRVGGLFNIIDSILTAAETFYPLAGHRLPECTIIWEDGNRQGTYYSNRTIYLYGGVASKPESGDDDSYDDSVIIHEYGHLLADLYSVDKTPGGSHRIDEYYEPTLSWSEGWASAVQCAVRRSGLYWDALDGDTGGFNIDFETGARNQVVLSSLYGLNNEGAVTGALYDLIDNGDYHDSLPGLDDDPADFDLSGLWQVITADFTPDVMATMDDFFAGWMNRYDQQVSEEVFAAHGMEFVPLAPHERIVSRRGINIPIPDNPGQKISVPLAMEGASTLRIQPDGVRLWVAIDHGRRGQLDISLRHPDGSAVKIKESKADYRTDVLEWYGYLNYDRPAESLNTFTGKQAAGQWTLDIVDSATGATGILRDVRLKVLTDPGVSLWQVY